MKILVTGGHGQLASEIRDIIDLGHADIGAIDPSYMNAEMVYAGSHDLDITNTSAVDACLSEGAFDIIINCAAMTNVDGCETDREGAFLVNATGVENLARAASKNGATLIHLSTDYVLAGTDSMPQDETAPCAPNTVYGASKLAGERAIQEICDKYFIIRTAWLYGHHGKNFVKTILRIANEHPTITVVDDQHGSPTNANDLAYELLKLAMTDGYGLYHCTGNGSCTWFDFARRIVELAGIYCDVQPCTSEQYAAPAKRPAYSILDNRHLRDTIGDQMRNWDDAIAAFTATR